MTIEHLSWKTNLERTTDIRVLEFADEVFLYERREVTKSISGRLPEKPTTTFVQGVIDQASVEAIKRGLINDVAQFDVTLGTKPDADYVPLMISDKGLKVIRIEGHPFTAHKVLENLTQSGDLVRKGGGQSFIDLFNNGFSAGNVFFASVKDYSIVDLTGKPIVVPSRFSYLEGLSSEYYDIDRVLEVVLNNPEVEVHEQYGNAKYVLPDYGDPDAPTRYGLTLTWRPTKKSWDKLLTSAAEKGVETKFVHFRAYDLLKQHDVLGIASAAYRAELEPEEEVSGPTL